MKNKSKNIFLSLIKKESQRQIENTINGKCIFLCYEPKIPLSIKKKIK